MEAFWKVLLLLEDGVHTTSQPLAPFSPLLVC